MTEDFNNSAEVNPYWAAAQERLRSAGVGVATESARPAHVPSATPSAAPGAFPPYGPAAAAYSSYFSHYTPVVMPTSSTPAAYNWYAGTPPLPPSSHIPSRLPITRTPQLRSAAVPYDYNRHVNRPPVRPINIRLPVRPGTSSPFKIAGDKSNEEVLGDPNSDFYLLGKHPASLKTYVDRALKHAQNPVDLQKCKDYLYDRIKPLLISGAVFAVKWEYEPLPHEKNYQLVTNWTPASQMKNKSTKTKKNDFSKSDDFSKSGRGPDILLSKSFNDNERLEPLSGPIFARGPGAAADSSNNKKRKNKGAANTAASFFDHDEYFALKKSRFTEDVESDSKNGSNHSANWLEDWIAENRLSRDRGTSGVLSRLQVLKLSEKPYRRAKARLPSFDGSRLARSFPKVLRGMGQGVVDEYFDRNLDRFNPDDCEEVIGECYEIEKKFFRLTKQPEASETRPLSVLERAFTRLVSLARENPSKYKYVCDQLRAIRQDLTVQKIRNTFTVAVYEFHARITLENKDLSEFNQCQTQLRHLYSELPGCKNEYEFTAYRLLYYIHTQDEQDILSLLNDLTRESRNSPSIKLAMDVHDAYFKGNYIRLLKLYDQTSKMCGNVMELFLDRERRRFFNLIRVSFRPNIDVDVLIRWFNFDSARAFCEYMLSQGVTVKPHENTEPPKWPVKPPTTAS